MPSKHFEPLIINFLWKTMFILFKNNCLKAPLCIIFELKMNNTAIGKEKSQ